MRAGSGGGLSRGMPLSWGSSRLWRRARWSDGRTISPLDDGIPVWARLSAMLLGMAGFWLYGRFDLPLVGTMPDARLLGVTLAVAAIGCWLASNGCLRAVAARTFPSSVPDGEDRYAVARPWSRWWRPARWPDGRHVATNDRLAAVLAVASAVLGITATWIFGRAGVPGIDVSGSWRRLGVLLFVPLLLLSYVSSRRIMDLAERDSEGVAPPFGDAASIRGES